MAVHRRSTGTRPLGGTVQRQLTLDVLVTPADRRAALLADVRDGLTATPKCLPPVWFYDEKGSLLFDEITRLPEYYLTRTERSLLAEHADAIVAAAGADTLVELGSGTSEKTRIILDAMSAAGTLRRIVLFDISREVLSDAAAVLGRDYDVEVHAIVGDFSYQLPRIPRGGLRLWAFLGSTLGNFTGRARARLLADLQTAMTPADHLLLGTDLVKSSDRLVAAYDDAAGVTAAFNRNVLSVLDAELGATFDPGLFEHRAVWNAEQEWIEMRLRSRVAQTVSVRDLDLTLSFDEGEEVLTEISAKFRPERLGAELEGAGLTVEEQYRDGDADYQLTLAQPHC
jgi:L-histidine N-alpha-methyltransferase